MRKFEQAMAEAGLEVAKNHIQHGDFTRMSGSIIATRLLRLPTPPTALVCADDLITLGCMEGLHAAGLDMPNDMSLVGFDDIPIASLHGVGLTTVRQPPAEMGSRAVRLLLDRIEGHGPDAPIIDIPPAELVTRTSCGTPRGASARHNHQVGTPSTDLIMRSGPS